MSAADLNPRALVALRHLAVTSNAAPPASAETSWHVPRCTVYAFQTADALVTAGLGSRSPNGAANTLSALKRRGLAANDGGGCFVQAKWWITPEGEQRLAAEGP